MATKKPAFHPDSVYLKDEKIGKVIAKGMAVTYRA